MAFFSTLISTVLKMLFIGVFAVEGFLQARSFAKEKTQRIQRLSRMEKRRNRRKCGSFLNSIILTSHQNLFIIRI